MGTRHSHWSVAPAAASHHTILAGTLVDRVIFGKLRIRLTVIYIFDPLPYIAEHVEQSVTVRLKAADRRRNQKFVVTAKGCPFLPTRLCSQVRNICIGTRFIRIIAPETA